MPLVNIVIALIIVGMGLYLINRFIPMASSIKTILNVVVVSGPVLYMGIAVNRTVGANLQLSALGPLSSPKDDQPSMTQASMTQEGYGQAYRKGFVRTVRLLRSRGASMDYAEDMAQTAWLQGWKKLDQLRDEGMIVSWVNAIAINYHRRGLRTQARYQALTDLCGHIGIDLAPLDTAKILKFCRPGDRILFEHQLGGLTTQEITPPNHGVSTTAIRIRLLRARRAVRARLEDRAVQLRQRLGLKSALRRCG